VEAMAAGAVQSWFVGFDPVRGTLDWREALWAHKTLLPRFPEIT